MVQKNKVDIHNADKMEQGDLIKTLEGPHSVSLMFPELSKTDHQIGFNTFSLR